MSSTPEASFTLQRPWPLAPPGGGETTRTFMEIGPVLLALLALTLFLVAGTYLFHRFRSRKSRHRSRPAAAQGIQARSAGGVPPSTPRRRRRRRSRRINPTLAETGGLPEKHPDSCQSRQSVR